MKQAADIVSILFISREQAHREHLKTGSYAKHIALGDLYDAVVDMADTFAETAQGLYGILDIPYGKPVDGAIDQVLEHHCASIEELRQAFTKPYESCLLNIIDEISALYSQTIYKLRRLK